MWPCSGRGLPCHHCYQWCGGLLPHRFTLTLGDRSRRGRFAFCCTFLEVSLTGRYPASCPAEPGLSSRTARRRISPRSSEHLKHSDPAYIARSRRREQGRLARSPRGSTRPRGARYAAQKAGQGGLASRRLRGLSRAGCPSDPQRPSRRRRPWAPCRERSAPRRRVHGCLRGAR